MTDSKIKAYPSKRFFIDMITRDIGLSECIMDMIDNSIDSLIKLHSIEVFNSLRGGVRDNLKEQISYAEIDINFDENFFSINDNCGGIRIEEARDKVFLFGSPIESEAEQNEDKELYTGLSVYGIGMKRAFFKIGKIIEFDSQHETESFKVTIDVEQWANETDWEFAFDETNDQEEKRAISERKTSIRITKLNTKASNRFKVESFRNELVKKIESAYALFLDIGLTIRVNGIEAEADLPKISYSEEIKPIKKTYNYPVEEDEDIEILLIAGLTPMSDNKPRGWYVFCNGRMVLEANRDERTGWGNNFPQFHSKYNHFVGFVYFRSSNVEALPWTTTKESIEIDNDAYQFALDQMRADARQITTFLNRLYPDDVEEDEGVEKEAFEKVNSISIDQVDDNEKDFSKVKKSTEPKTTISYKKPRAEVDEMKKCAGDPDMSNKDLGLQTYEYFQMLECS